MKQTFTLNQCLRMLYGETTPEESYMLSEIINHNTTLKREVEAMKETISSLGKPSFEPAPAVVDDILRYNSDKALNFSA